MLWFAARAIVTTSSQAKNAACIETGNETAKALGIDTSDGKWVVEAVCRKDNDGNWAPRVKELTGGKVRCSAGGQGCLLLALHLRPL